MIGIEGPWGAWAPVLAVLGAPLVLAYWLVLKNGDDGCGVPETKWWHDTSNHAYEIDPGIRAALDRVKSPVDE